MSLTVKQLIKQLELIENKFLEVKVCDKSNGYKLLDIIEVNKGEKKVLIFSEYK